MLSNMDCELLSNQVAMPSTRTMSGCRLQESGTRASNPTSICYVTVRIKTVECVQ